MMLFTIIFYNLILFITTFFAYLYSKLNDKYISKLSLSISIGIIVFITSFRSLSVGTDSKIYFEEYNNIDPSNTVSENILKNFGNFEPAFVFINHYFSKFEINYITLLIFYSSFIWYLIYKTFKNQKENFYIAFFFLYTNFLFFTFNGLRQAIASAIMFYAVTVLLNGRTIKFVLLIIFASLFHFSAILLILLFFLKNYNLKFTTIKWSVFYALSLIIPIKYLYVIIFKIAGFFPFYSSYSGRDDFYITSNFTLGVLYQVLIGYLFIYFYKKVAIDKKSIFYFNLALIANLSYNLFYSNPFITRIFIYLMFFQSFAFVYIFQYLLENNNKGILLLLVVIFLLIFSYRIFVKDSGAAPYQFNF